MYDYVEMVITGTEKCVFTMVQLHFLLIKVVFKIHHMLAK